MNYNGNHLTSNIQPIVKIAVPKCIAEDLLDNNLLSCDFYGMINLKNVHSYLFNLTLYTFGLD